jgi:hypothetical protein
MGITITGGVTLTGGMSLQTAAEELTNYFDADETSDWTMFGSSTVSEPTDGTFRFTRVAGNGNVAQYTVTGLTAGNDYIFYATGDTSQSNYSAEISIQDPVTGEIAVVDWSAGATNDTQSDTWTQPSGETSVIVRVRIAYNEGYTDTSGVWDFSNIRINEN